MKLRYKHIITAFFLLTSLSVAAQTRIYSEMGSNYKKPKAKTNSAGLYTDQYDGVHHLMGLQVEGAYSTLFASPKVMLASPGGYAAGLTLQYAYLNGPLFVQTGVGVRWQDVKNKVEDQKYMRDDVDKANMLSHVTYAFEQRKDEMREAGNGVNAPTNLTAAEGIFIVAVKDIAKTNVVDATGVTGASAFFDFYIRSCSVAPGSDVPTLMSTVIRLYDPDVAN